VVKYQKAPGVWEAGMVAVVGVPSDENSSFMRGPAEAPEQIRQALHAGSSNLCAENGLDLGAEPRFGDAGDLELESGPVVFDQIERGIRDLLERDVRILSLGGDHAVTLPIVRAHAKKYGPLHILHLDAHPDLYDEFEGNRYSHACPFARIMEENLAARLVQIGIRTMNPHQRAQAERFGIEVVETNAWPSRKEELGSFLDFGGPVYLSLDMDVLDPAFAPGVSHHEPGGLTTRDVVHIIQGLPIPIVGADIVELNPRRDPIGITTMAAVKFLKEIASNMLQRA
jgi:agmatinase